MKNLIWVLACYLVMQCSVFAQSDNANKVLVFFTTRDIGTKQVIANIKCEFKDENGGVKALKSDVYGLVSTFLPASGNYEIIFQGEGYEAQKMSLKMDEIHNATFGKEIEMMQSSWYLFRGSLYNSKADKFMGGVSVKIKNLYTGSEFYRKSNEVGLFTFVCEPKQKYEIVTMSQDLLNKRAVVNMDCGEGDEVKFCLSGFSFQNYVDADFEPKTLIGTVLLDSIKINKSYDLSNIQYASGSATISPQAAKILDDFAGLLKDNPQINIELSSYTDCRGDAVSNMQLSQKRADAATSYLITKGIAKNRIVPVGKGESEPLNKCVDGVPCSEEEHQVNRRTSFRIITLQKP